MTAGTSRRGSRAGRRFHGEMLGCFRADKLRNVHQPLFSADGRANHMDQRLIEGVNPREEEKLGREEK